MNILLDDLPTVVKVDGQVWPIRTDFRVWIRLELLLQDKSLPPEEVAEKALTLCYPAIPHDVGGALEALLWFYRCGVDKVPATSKSGGDTAKKPKRAYDFEQDAGRLYAAFWSVYQIDLASEGLHWWVFRELMRNLPASCDFAKIMGYRTADTAGMDKAQKKHINKMRQIYALHSDAPATLTARDRQMLDYVAKRYKEAESNKNQS